jgi:hypothetical protein
VLVVSGVRAAVRGGGVPIVSRALGNGGVLVRRRAGVTLVRLAAAALVPGVAGVPLVPGVSGVSGVTLAALVLRVPVVTFVPLRARA